MRGRTSRVSTRDGAPTSGRLVDVVDAPRHARPRDKDNTKDKDAETRPEEREEPALVALLLTDAGELQRFSDDIITGVRPTDPAFFARLGTALDAVDPRRSRNPRLAIRN